MSRIELSFKRYTSGGMNLLPHLAVGYEPGAWGYPAESWIACGWLCWTWQLSWSRGQEK